MNDQLDMPINDNSFVTPACNQCVLLSKIRLQEARIEVGSDMWKWVATTLGGALLACFSFWFTAQSGAVSRSDMESYIQKNSPYAIDRQVVVTSLEDLKDGQKNLKSQIEAMKERQDRIIAVLENQGKMIR